MKILLDEMYTGLKAFLQALGWEVVTVEEEGIRGTDDLGVVEHAKKNGLLLVSQDPKVADIAQLKGVGCVIVGSVEIAKVIDQKLKAVQQKG